MLSYIDLLSLSNLKNQFLITPFRYFQPWRKLLCVFICLFGFNILHAQETKKTFSITLEPNVQLHQLQWSIAGNMNGTNPNVYSELEWNHIVSSALRMNLHAKIHDRIYFEMQCNQGVTLRGTATDTDYTGDNRTNVVFFAKVQSKTGSTTSLSSALGYNLISKPAYQLKIGGGYILERQNLFLTDDNSLNSNYLTNWSGPLIKTEQQFNVFNRTFFTVAGSYAQTNYRARANWNLIESLQHPVSFRHKAKGFGVEGSAELKIHLTSSWTAGFGTSACYWSTGKGIDELYLVDGTVQRTRLNDVTRRGILFYFGVELSW